MTKHVKYAILLYLVGSACTTGSADVDADLATDARPTVDAAIGCSVSTACDDGYECCLVGDVSFCVDTDIDRNNCGDCGVRCDPSATDRCDNGGCVCGQDPACPEGIACCGDQGCANTDENCGTCGNLCTVNYSCQDGACLCQGQTCASDQTCCGAGCVDLQSDVNNCGGCGVQCSPDETCSNGECICEATGQACPSGHTCCTQGCRNLTVDYDNCGSCLFQCNDDNTCESGTCEGMSLEQPVAPPSRVTQVAMGGRHACALGDDGSVRCWGDGLSGRLGRGHILRIGDDEVPATVGAIRVGTPLAALATGGTHSCAITDSRRLRCWGNASKGQLGYGNTENIGDNEIPVTAGVVNVGGPVVKVTAGYDHTCAILASGAVRCWGDNGIGQLGYGNTDNIGDDEPPADAGDVFLGALALDIAASGAHTCAIVTSGSVRCWGQGGFGRLGYGNSDVIGDDEPPASAGNVNVGGPVVQIATGTAHTCALLNTGNVRCWGAGLHGRLGYGNTENIGDDETPADAGDVNVGGPVVQIAVGTAHSCALLADGNVRCWGQNSFGQTGYGTVTSIGDNETPATAGDVALGGIAIAIAAAEHSTCALLATGEVKCWGENGQGQLGLGHVDDIGNNETPASQPAIRLF